MLRYIYILVISFFLGWFSIPTIAAQEKWEKIPFQEWRRKEVKAVLVDSPWSKVIEASTNLTPQLLGQRGVTLEESALVILRSALPIRQALLRERQLDFKYDKMNQEQKQIFDAENRPLLECLSCEQYYAVSIISKIYVLNSIEMNDSIQDFVYLSNEKGDRRNAVRIINQSTSNETTFLFPRLNEKGEPLLTEKNKKLIFTLKLDSSNYGQPLFTKLEFDIGKILRNGKVIF